MNLRGFSEGAIDWTQIAPVEVKGTRGAAPTRGRQLGEVQLRLVAYEPGYLADHWCSKGHAMYVVSGALTVEHEDGSAAFELKAGMSWCAPDGASPAHRVRCEGGAQVFIVD